MGWHGGIPTDLNVEIVPTNVFLHGGQNLARDLDERFREDEGDGLGRVEGVLPVVVRGRAQIEGRGR